MSFTFLAVTFISPIVEISASNNPTRLGAEVNAMAAITIDPSNILFNVTPTSGGTFQSEEMSITVNGNSTGGYELYFSSSDNETDMIHTDQNVGAVISSDFNGSVTENLMAVNTWGYSLDGVNFQKIPTLSNQIRLKNVEHFPEANERTSTVYLATKISSSIPSGRYEKSITISAIAHATIPSLYVLNFDCGSLGNNCPEVMEDGTITGSKTFTIPDTIPTRNYHTFVGWAEEEIDTCSGETPDVIYQPGDTVTLSTSDGTNVSKNLYAFYQRDEEITIGGLTYTTCIQGKGSYPNSTSGNMTGSVPYDLCAALAGSWHVPTRANFQTSFSTEGNRAIAAELYSEYWGNSFFWTSTFEAYTEHGYGTQAYYYQFRMTDGFSNPGAYHAVNSVICVK